MPYINIRKLREDQVSAEYRFGDDMKGQWGRLRLDTRSGKVVLIESGPGDKENRDFGRAAYKLSCHWKAGELPDATEWVFC
jgi:hypothetical protein